MTYQGLLIQKQNSNIGLHNFIWLKNNIKSDGGYHQNQKIRYLYIYIVCKLQVSVHNHRPNKLA